MRFTYKYNIQARSRNHRFHGKAISIILYVSTALFFKPGCKVHAPYNSDICGLSDCTKFYHFVSYVNLVVQLQVLVYVLKTTATG